MKKIMKRLMEIFLRILNKFKGYDEEIVLGFDVDQLMNDPNKDTKIRKMLEENDELIQMQKDKYHQLMDQLVVTERMDTLSNEAFTELRELCRSYSELLVNKENIEVRKVEAEKKDDPSIGEFNNNIPRTIDILKQHEKHQQNVRKDLDMLEAEKENLKRQFSSLMGILTFLKGFLIVLAVFTLLAAIVISSQIIIYENDVFVPALLTILGIGFFFLWFFFFRRYATVEIKKNQLLQQRVVKLLNKTKLKFFRNQRLLDYEYGKYKVDSSEVLELRYENHMTAVTTQENYEEIQKKMRSIVMDMDRLLSRMHVENIDFILRHVDYFSTEKGVEVLQEKLKKARNDQLNEIKHLEEEKKVLTNLLTKK